MVQYDICISIIFIVDIAFTKVSPGRPASSRDNPKNNNIILLSKVERAQLYSL